MYSLDRANIRATNRLVLKDNRSPTFTINRLVLRDNMRANFPINYFSRVKAADTLQSAKCTLSIETCCASYISRTKQ